MGLFRAAPQPAIGTASTIAAAAGSSGRPGQFQYYVVGSNTARALSIPTVSRAVGLITSMIGGLEFRTYTMVWDAERENYERIYVPGESWMTRPDPRTTRNFMMASTVQDLMLHGRAFWYVTSRYNTGFPASFTWLPADNVNTLDQAGPEWFGPSDNIQFNGVDIDTDNVVQFLSPVNGMLWTGNRAIQIAYELDEAAKRFATNAGGISSGYLQQKEGEPMGGDELAELAQAWSTARGNLAVGALNQYVEWVEFKSNPSNLQLMEGRQHAALELARVFQVPAWLVGVAIGGMTYQNSQQARQDLYLFGAKPYVDCIEQTLSLDTVVARGKHVELDIGAYLREAELPANIVEEPRSETEDATA